MSMFGRGSSAPSGAVNPERVEVAIQEYVLIPFTTSAASDPTHQVGHGHRYFQPPCLVSGLTGICFVLFTLSFQDMPRQMY
jgi:hypothetical protein